MRLDIDDFFLFPWFLTAGTVVLSRVTRLRSVNLTVRAPAGIPSVTLEVPFLLILSGWLNFIYLIIRRTGYAVSRPLNIGFLIGVAIATAAVRMGVQFEQRRLEQGSGTPRASMTKRAALFFFALAIVAVMMRVFRILEGMLSTTILVSLCAIWIPAGVAWRLWPKAGPLEPMTSLACRASLFGLAVTALVSLGAAGSGDSALVSGIWMGEGISVVLVLSAVWLATRFPPRTAVVLVGGLAGLSGVCLAASL